MAIETIRVALQSIAGFLKSDIRNPTSIPHLDSMKRTHSSLRSITVQP